MGSSSARERTGVEGKLNLVSKLQAIARFQGVWSNDALAIDKGAVGAVQILDDIPGPRPREARVPP